MFKVSRVWQGMKMQRQKVTSTHWGQREKTDALFLHCCDQNASQEQWAGIKAVGAYSFKEVSAVIGGEAQRGSR